MTNQKITRFLVGSSELMMHLSARINRAAETSLPVLICGETGTGKEVVARAIHTRSKHPGPLIDVNCAAFSETLLDSELFGHEKGAFTGADKLTEGKFELAHGGTIFLDEIGELSLIAQAKLLRVLESREVVRIGGRKSIKLDFRLIAATNRDLGQMVRDRTFRQDLYYRLNAYLITTPALRERVEDIALLAYTFLYLFSSETQRVVHSISPEVLDLFEKYPWPGNVRELQNIVRRAVLDCEGETLQLADVSFDLTERIIVTGAKLGKFRDVMEKTSLQLCRYALEASNNNRPQAAKLLGLDRGHFHRLIKKHGLDRPSEA